MSDIFDQISASSQPARQPDIFDHVAAQTQAPQPDIFDHVASATTGYDAAFKDIQARYPDPTKLLVGFRGGLLNQRDTAIANEAIRRGDLFEENDGGAINHNGTGLIFSDIPYSPTRTTVNPMVDRIVAAEEAKRGTPFSPAERLDMIANLNSQMGQRTPQAPAPQPVQQQAQPPQSAIGNFATAAVSSFADPLANLVGRGLNAAGIISDERLQQGIDTHPLPYDPQRLSGVLGAGVGQGLEAVAAGPAAPALFTAQTGEQAIEHVVDQVASGKYNVSNTQAAFDVAGQAAIAAIIGKLAPGQRANAAIIKSLAPTLESAFANAVKNVAISGGVHIGEAEVQNLAANAVTKYTGVNPEQDLTEGSGDAAIQGGMMGVAGQATHEFMARGKATAGYETAKPSTEQPPVEAPTLTPEQHVSSIEESYRQLNDAKAKLKNGPNPELEKTVDHTAAEIQSKLMDYESVAGEDAAENLRSKLEAPAAVETPKPVAAKSEHPAELADAKQVGEWYGKTFKDPANAQTIEALASMHPGKYKLMDVPIDQIDPNTMMAGDTNRAKVDAIKALSPEERAKLPPIIAVGEGDKLMTADGTHRLTAEKEAGAKTIKAYVPEEFANDPSQLKRFIGGEVEAPVKLQLGESVVTDAPNGTKVYKYTPEINGKRVTVAVFIRPDGTALPNISEAGKNSIGIRGVIDLKNQLLAKHPEITKFEFERVGTTGGPMSRQGELDVRRSPVSEKAAPAEAPKELPRIPSAAREWSLSKLKTWANDAGYKVSKLHNLDAIRKGMIRQRNDSLIDLPRLPKDSAEMSFKKLKYWAEQSGYDVSKIEGLRDLKAAIEFQRKDALGTAKGRPLDEQAHIDHEQKIQAIQNARRSIQSNPMPTGESTSHAPRAPRTFEELATPLKSRIEDISKPVAGKVMRMEFDKMKIQADWITPLEAPGERLQKELGPKDGDKYVNFKIAMLNGDVAGAKELVPESMHKDVDAWFASSPKALEHIKAAGGKVGEIENHIGREVSDYEGLKQVIGDPYKGEIAEAWDLAKQTLGKAMLTAQEKVEIANKVMQGFGPRKPGQTGPGFAKERSLTVTPETVGFYKDPFESQTNYLRRAADYASKVKFLGKDTENMKDSIGKVLKPEIESGRLTGDKADELNDLIHTLFTSDNLKTAPAWRTTKDLIHAATLSQFRNAINQITDVAITGYDYGSHVGGAIKDALKITPAEGRIIAKELGIEHGGYQFRNPGKIGQYVDAVTKRTGFQKLDIFGKENRLNGAYRWAQDAAKNPDSAAFKTMEGRYKDMLGKDWEPALADLRSGAKTQNSQFIPFLELTRLQPVTKANMPEGYLKAGGAGRTVYALKSFILNQMDFVRRDVVRNLATKGQRAQGLKNMAGLIATLSVANFGKDFLVNLVRGKRMSADDMPDEAMNSVLGIVGLSTFLVKEAARKPSDAIMDFLGPPTPVMDDLAHDIGMPFKDKGFTGLSTVRTLPGIGDLLYYWTPLGRGYYMNQDAAKKEYTQKLSELRKAADDAEQQGDEPTAKELIALYNSKRVQAPPEYVESGAKPRPKLTSGSPRQDLQRKAQQTKDMQKRKDAVLK